MIATTRTRPVTVRRPDDEPGASPHSSSPDDFTGTPRPFRLTPQMTAISEPRQGSSISVDELMVKREEHEFQWIRDVEFVANLRKAPLGSRHVDAEHPGALPGRVAADGQSDDPPLEGIQFNGLLNRINR